MRRRLLLSYLAVTLVVLLVLLVPLGAGYRSRQVDQAKNALQRQAFLVAAFAEDSLEHDADRPVDGVRGALARAHPSPEDRVAIVDRHGQTLTTTGSPTPRPALVADARTAVSGGVVTRTSGGRVTVAVPIASQGNVYGAVAMSTSLQPVDERTQSYWLQLALIAAIALAVVVVAGVVLARGVTGPLERLGAAATRLGEGDLTARPDVERGPTEVRRLAVDLRRMANRLAALVQSQNEFVADASHELRTPLTALRLRLENLATDVGSGPGEGPRGEAAGDVDAALVEVERLSRLVDGLLALARSEEPRTPSVEVDLVELLADRVHAWQPLAEEVEVDLLDAGAPAVHVVADLDRLTQVLDNLLANALEAAGPGGRVEVRGEAVGRKVSVHVVDDGPGLSATDRARAFDRFWRAPGSGPGGTGLGLAVVARLAAADGGEVRLDPADPHGVDAVVTYERPAGRRVHPPPA